MRVTILGCGSSNGVPTIGNKWGACNPSDPRNRRRRPSILIEAHGTTLLVDTTPDLREQLLDADVQYIDAVLYTHAHADHTHGIDDLREVNRLMQSAIPAFADVRTLKALIARFGYCFDPHPAGHGFHRPVLVAHPIDGPVTVGPVTVLPFEQDHGFSVSLGFRIGAFAYSTDVVHMPEAAFDVLAGIDTWLVDCVRVDRPHPVHAHLPITLGWIKRLQPRRAILTHMNNSMDFVEISRQLPPGVELAFDGQVIEVEDLAR